MPIVERPPSVLPKIAMSAVLLAGAGAIAHLATEPPLAYKMIDAAVQAPRDGEHLLVHGYVVPGSIVALAPDVHDFVLEFHGERLRVRHVGVVPDVFRDQGEVIEEGTMEMTPRGWQVD